MVVAKGGRGPAPEASQSVCVGARGNPGWGTFFTGLIDDIRIYNRAVKP